METREAIKILLKMQEKYTFSVREKKAVITAVGVLDSATLSLNRIKGIVRKRKDKLGRISTLGSIKKQ